MLYETLLYQKEGHLATVTLNRPDRLNALSRQLFYELDQLVTEVEGDEEVRVVVITGAGRAFCAGADIKERVEHADDLRYQRTGAIGSRTFRRMERLPKVFIAAVNGVAAGGGCELALACDLRIASAQAQFALPEIKLGIMPGAGGTQRMPRLVGRARAREMMFLGEFVSAEQALAWGMVNRVAAPDALMAETRKMAETLLERPPLSLAMIKTAVNTGSEIDLDSGLEVETRCAWFLHTTEDRQEGMRAFVEKRKPVFRGE